MVSSLLSVILFCGERTFPQGLTANLVIFNRPVPPSAIGGGAIGVSSIVDKKKHPREVRDLSGMTYECVTFEGRCER
ncbi:hypothetical protein HMPREF2890_05485 [Porphyromonas sp. HMSC065F10]|nr:hypothetical protein HMPREF2890_05485 [Porphyromonas sp. HMSC065F10]